MNQQGRFTKDRMGYDMPADAPLYAKPPIYYRNVEAIQISYETDLDAALDLLPQGLEIMDTATAALMLIRYPFSTLGPYEEAILGIYCLWQGEMRFYIPHIVVNNDIPQAAGREIWGFPKKMAHITLKNEADLMWGKVERPPGNPICTAGIRPEKEAEMETGEVTGLSVCLKIVPSPEAEAEPSLAQLVEVPSKMKYQYGWQGTGWIQFDTMSAVDPWYKLPVKQIIDARFVGFHSELGYGRVIKEY